MTKYSFVLLLVLLATKGFAQTKIDIDGVNSQLVSAQAYEKTIRHVIKQPVEGHGIIPLDSLKEESFIIVGANNDAFLFWISPGDKIILNAANGESTGGNQKINNFLRKWKEEYLVHNTLQYNWLLSYGITTKYKDYNMDVFFADDYVEKLQPSTQEQLEMLKNEKFEDKDFTSYFSNFINTGYWLTLIKADNLITFKEQNTPTAVFNATLKMNIDESILQQKEKSTLLNGYIRANEGLKLIKPSHLDYVYQKASVIKNQTVQEEYVLDQLQRLISQGETLYVKELFESSLPLIKTQSGREKYDELYGKINTDKSAHTPALDLTAYDTAGNIKKLSDFKGKYIYIDVWATWCGPCKQMSPFFMKLADQYKGQNIVFLSLSADRVRDEQKWKDYVKEHFSNNCVALWTGSAFDNDFIRKYGITSIPRFLMVDPDGNIFSSKFWRPNDPRLPVLIDTLLESGN
ncbi:MAG: TlpA family protein disulfide reductase [Draconibacterium sp.]